jgi:hypothetical protein
LAKAPAVSKIAKILGFCFLILFFRHFTFSEVSVEWGAIFHLHAFSTDRLVAKQAVLGEFLFFVPKVVFGKAQKTGRAYKKYEKKPLKEPFLPPSAAF